MSPYGDDNHSFEKVSIFDKNVNDHPIDKCIHENIIIINIKLNLRIAKKKKKNHKKKTVVHSDPCQKNEKNRFHKIE